MKINYHDEDYKAIFKSFFICLVFIILVLLFGVINYIEYKDLEIFLLCSIFIVIILIPMIFMFFEYKKRKQKRNYNLFIIKEGICIIGKVVKIYDDYLLNWDLNHRFHDVKACVTFNYEDSIKEVVVSHLNVDIRKLDKYLNKEVKVYVYNNKVYVDILN